MGRLNRCTRSLIFRSSGLLAVVLFAVAPALSQEAKNVVLMISDGAGFNAFAAASYYEHGSLGHQPYDKFPVKLACTTLALDSDGRVQVYDPLARWSDFTWATDKSKARPTDSAAAATAIYTGVKTCNGALSVNIDRKPLATIGQLAKALGKSVGVVTSVRFADATPAALAAHNVSRKKYEAIVKEMIYGDVLDVIMGCGSPDYDAMGNLLNGDARGGYQFVGGKATWEDLKAGTARPGEQDGEDHWSLIESKEAFESLARGSVVPRRVIGVPRTRATLQYGAGGKASKAGKPYDPPFNVHVPTLVVMAKGAINVLSRNVEGFLLLIEGGAVDSANHDNNMGRMIEEQMEFNKAVACVIQWVEENSNWSETLLIVTSDHECGNIWGPDSGPREGFGGFAWDPVANKGAGEIPGHRYHSKGHSSALVPVYAIGAGSSLFAALVDGVDPVRGRYVDNTDIFTVMRRAIGAAPGGQPGRLWAPQARLPIAEAAK